MPNLTLRITQMAAAIILATAGCAAESQTDQTQEELAGLSQELQRAPSVPAEIATPEGARYFFKLHARGTQLYSCKQTGETVAWTFVEPDARLYGPFGIPVGHHYAGPTWELFDGSSVVGARVAGVSVDTSAIPLLLLKAASHAGRGILSRVTFIQRLDTVGGNAPSAGCDAAHLAETVEVPYTATYAFYR